MTPMVKIDPEVAQRMVQAQQAQQLLVKELADALKVSRNYVYQMRACGFEMHGKNWYGQTATEAEARAWIEKMKFRMVMGAGVIG